MVIKHQQTSIRKKQIANAARRILIKKGSKELTIRAIAKLVGITEGTIYQHVKSKKEILSLIVDVTSEEILNDFKVVPVDGDLSLDKLESIVRGYISTADERQRLFQAVAQLVSANDKGIKKKISEAGDQITDALRALISQAIKSGHAKEDLNLSGAAMVLLAILDYLSQCGVINNGGIALEERYLPMWLFSGMLLPSNEG
jgi:AcrR family transcriptional regulator